MKSNSKYLLLIGVLVSTLLSACTQATSSYGTVEFYDREIDIKSFFTAFPYSPYSITMSEDGSKVFYTRTGETTDLVMLDLTEDQNLDNGVKICDENFAVKNLWGKQYNSKDNCLYWIGDEKNDEIINIYRLNLETKELKRLTDVPYIYGWDINEEGTKIAYVARMAQNENRLDNLHILDLETLEDKIVYTDKPDYRMTWSSISVQPDGKGAILDVLKDADRTYTNVAYIDFESSSLKIVTNPAKAGSYAGTVVLSPWYNASTAYFTSDQSGFANLYSYNTATKKTTQITDFKFDIEAEWIESEGKKYIAAISNSPLGSKLMILDPVSGKEIAAAEYTAAISLMTTHNNEIFMSAGAVDIIYEVWRVKFEGGALSQEVILDLPSEMNDKLVRSTVERLSIPTFDTDPATGETREIHAYLMTPKNPLPEGKRMVMIQSFYGGSNAYDLEHQIFADAGIYVLSPSPRGTAGFGRDFAALNDGDLGGDEIIDIIECAKYVSEKLNIPAERIGVFGMSHGGYATMRLMTFPGEINGNTASFPFGFGVAAAGFADIIYQHYHSNIPDWTQLEAGDPKVDSVRIADRSPIYHVDKITGPLLLIHGTNDDRVNIYGSQVIYDALSEIGKPVEFLKVEGQGHGFKGVENNVLYYSTVFDFLEKI
ncbi:MAG: prolyl oligopeptidase family serine peptidase [Rikenellaceae bacterium]